jgi:MFS family permease
MAFRALQGLSAGMMQATAIAVIATRLEKEEMVKAIGILGMLMGLGPTLGPVLGGFILSSIGWRWIFWLNIPICIYGLYSCQKLKITNEILHSHPLSYFNLILFGFSMLLLLLSMNYIIQNRAMAVSLFMATIVVFSLHVYVEIKSAHPIINYHLFKKISFSAPMLGVIALGGATAIAFIVPPLFFQKLRQFEAWQVGLVSLSAPLGIVIASRIFSKLSKVYGTNLSMMLGITMMLVSLIVLTKMQIEWSTILIFSLLFVYGLGVGFLMTSNIIHLTSQFSLQKQAFISSFIRMIQNAAVAFGAAGSAMLISLKAETTANSLMLGIQHAWWLATMLTIIAFVALGYMFVAKESSKISMM